MSHVHQESHFTQDQYTAPATIHPFAEKYNLPSYVTNWRSGQPVPSGWRVGRKGYLKPAFTPTGSLASWQQGQPIPQGYKLSKRGTLRPANYFDWFFANSNNGLQQQQLQQQQAFHPFASQYNLPPSVATWQQGQPIPQGWRLGRKGFLKPAFTPTPQLAQWQQGQPLPQGFRLNKRGTLRPANYFQYWSMTAPTGPMMTAPVASTIPVGAFNNVANAPGYVSAPIMPNANYGSGAYVAPYGSAPGYTTYESATSQRVSHTPPGQSVGQDLLGATKEIGHRLRDKVHQMAVQHETRPNYVTTQNVTRETTYKPLP